MYLSESYVNWVPGGCWEGRQTYTDTAQPPRRHRHRHSTGTGTGTARTQPQGQATTVVGAPQVGRVRGSAGCEGGDMDRAPSGEVTEVTQVVGISKQVTLKRPRAEECLTVCMLNVLGFFLVRTKAK